MEQGPTRRRWLRSKWKIGIGILLLLALPLLALVAWDYLSQRLADQELARLKASGSPVTIAELEAFYALPPGADDVTRLWLSGSAGLATKTYVKSLPIVGDDDADIPPPGKPWADLKEAQRLLVKCQPELALLHDAAARGGAARYPTNFKAGTAMLLVHIQQLRSVARLLDLEARVKAHEGDAQGAAESIHALFKLAGSLEHEPTLISQLVRIAIDGVGRQTLEELLPHTAFGDGDLAFLQADLLATDYEAAMVRTLQSERALSLEHFRDPGNLGSGVSSLTWRLTRGQDLRKFLSVMEQSIDIASQPAKASRAAMDEFERSLTKANSSVVHRARYPLTSLIFDPHTTFAWNVRGTAASRIAATALAVQRHRRTHGALPKLLQDLSPELLSSIPTDPFDGQPLRYAVRGAGFVVYSIGENGKDDGGKGDYHGKPDVVFTVKRGLEK